MNQGWGRPGGSFLRILGIDLLIELIRRRRERRHSGGGSGA